MEFLCGVIVGVLGVCSLFLMVDELEDGEI